VVATSKGKGFAGTIKRWGFSSQPATHGQSDRERAPGSIGGTTTPGRVYKGKKMAGHMGAKKKTVWGLKVIEIDNENNIVKISGAIPGPRKGTVTIQYEPKEVGSQEPVVGSEEREESGAEKKETKEETNA